MTARSALNDLARGSSPMLKCLAADRGTRLGLLVLINRIYARLDASHKPEGTGPE